MIEFLWKGGNEISDVCNNSVSVGSGFRRFAFDMSRYRVVHCSHVGHCTFQWCKNTCKKLLPCNLIAFCEREAINYHTWIILQFKWGMALTDLSFISQDTEWYNVQCTLCRTFCCQFLFLDNNDSMKRSEKKKKWNKHFKSLFSSWRDSSC